MDLAHRRHRQNQNQLSAQSKQVQKFYRPLQIVVDGSAHVWSMRQKKKPKDWAKNCLRRAASCWAS